MIGVRVPRRPAVVAWLPLSWPERVGKAAAPLTLGRRYVACAGISGAFAHQFKEDRVMIKRSTVAGSLLASSILAAVASGALAAEGSTTHYYAGLQGALGFALPPSPGLSVDNVLWSESGHVDETVLAWEVIDDVDIDTMLDIVVATYAFDARLLGGTYSVAVYVPFGSVSVSGYDASGDRVDEHAFGLGDVEVVPFQLHWNRGDFYFKLSQSIVLPVGSFDEDRIANVGQGHWSFDTVGAVTYYNPNWGTEVSAALGLMHNSENTDTEYRTQNESHFDFAINQYLTEGFALGIQGYRLNQLKGDSGEGALLGPLEGFSRGIGAGFKWLPAAGHGDLVVSAAYMSDFEARDGRVESEHAQLSVSWTF